MADIRYSFAAGADLPAIQTLLADCRLSAEGMELLTDNCITAKAGSKLVGTVALEPYE